MTTYARRLAAGVQLLALATLLGCGAPSNPDRRPATPPEKAAATEERERLDAVVAAEALKQFASSGSHEELARSLSGIAANPTSAGRTAKALLDMLRAPAAFAPNPTGPAADIDALLKRQIDALVYERCAPRDDGAPNAVVASLIGFGYTALDALEMAKSDRRLSRCVGIVTDDSLCSIDPSACHSGPGPVLPSVRTVGSLAASRFERSCLQVRRSIEAISNATSAQAASERWTVSSSMRSPQASTSEPSRSCGARWAEHDSGW